MAAASTIIQSCVRIAGVPHRINLTICDHCPSMAFARTLRHQPLGVIGILLLMLFVTIAVLAPAITPYDPAAIDLYHRLTPPSHAHWFGTDELGRDIFSRILSGARLSLMVAVSVVGLSLSLGLVLGASQASTEGAWIRCSTSSS